MEYCCRILLSNATRREVTIEPSLAWVLQPLPVQTFLDTVWSARHHHVERSHAGYFDGLLPAPSIVDDLLERFRAEPSAVRLVKEGARTKGGAGYRRAQGSLDTARIRADFADGYTIVFDGVERYVHTVAALSAAIEVELNFPTQVNAYLTPPHSTGLGPHHDDHDVLILQVRGGKSWRVYEGADVAPCELRREAAVETKALPPPAELHLNAGDVLYLPRGRIHAARTASEPSVHLSVGIHAPTVLMLAIGALHSLSGRDDRLNARLPPRHLDDADTQATLGALLREAVATVAGPGAVAAGLEPLAEVLVRRGRCPPIGQVARAAAIEARTLVRKYRPLYSRVQATADGVALQFASLSISAGREHEAAMRFLSASTEPFRVCELPGLGADQRIELVRSLITCGFLVRLSDH